MRAIFRDNLPQLKNQMFLTDGGLETTLIFHEHLELPFFAAFHLLNDPSGIEQITRYFSLYADIAKQLNVGFIFESPTWRANKDWGDKLGYNAYKLDQLNKRSIQLLSEIRNRYMTPASPMVISGCIGPRGDGYQSDNRMSVSDAQKYHAVQIQSFAESDADMVCALTINYSEEGIGITNAAMNFNMPVVISFTLETDGKLPSGQSLHEAIQQLDQETNAYPSYYMVNCAHPTHFKHLFNEKRTQYDRVKGLRANASSKSHAELDEADALDSGNPDELGKQFAELKNQLTQLTVLGGCCGTDLRHIQQIAEQCLPLFQVKL